MKICRILHTSVTVHQSLLAITVNLVSCYTTQLLQLDTPSLRRQIEAVQELSQYNIGIFFFSQSDILP